jgi:hypothetical protein
MSPSKGATKSVGNELLSLRAQRSGSPIKKMVRKRFIELHSSHHEKIGNLK